MRRVAAGVVAGALLAGFAGAVHAQEKESKSTQTEAEWIAYDAAASTVSVKVRKPGRGKDARLLKANQQATFKVKADGSVLTRTTVTINGRKAEFANLPPGKRVNVYWRPEADGTLFARKIDAIFSEEELDAKYGVAE